jgi:hypothetical protein
MGQHMFREMSRQLLNISDRNVGWLSLSKKIVNHNVVALDK